MIQCLVLVQEANATASKSQLQRAPCTSDVLDFAVVSIN